MARLVAVGAALGAPCMAFVPPSKLPSALVDPITQQGASLGPQTAAPQASSTCVVAAGLATAGAALITGARAAQRVRRAPSIVGCSAVGVCLPLTEKWDPLNLGSTDTKMDRYTSVEIKHGRVSMIACVGYLVPELFRFPGCEGVQHGLAALPSIPAEGWFQITAFVGLHEIFIKPRKGGLGPWDLGFGTEFLERVDAEELERRQTVERNNGRLAMVAIMGLMVQDGMFGKTPISLLKVGGWWGPPVDYLIKDIPICSGVAGCGVRPATRGPGITAMRATVYADPFARSLNFEDKNMSPAVPFLRFPEQLEGWVGGEKGFDPLGVTDALPVYLVREAELKHGRVCMLATIGWIATDVGARFPAPIFQGVSTLEAHDKMVEAGYMDIFLAFIGTLEVYNGWLLLQGFEGKVKRAAGDFFFGKNFMPRDEDGAKMMQLKELENGRLAMLAFSGIVTQAALFPEKTWPFL